LVPEIKGYSRDLVPGIAINPKERVAIMRKGGAIRLQGEYFMMNGHLQMTINSLLTLR